MKKIILIRHAESQEDVNPNMHNIYDLKIGITSKGREQSIALANELKQELATCKRLRVFHSPSKRVRDTAYFILSQLKNKKINVAEVECIRNLNWGDTNPQNMREVSQQRYNVGVLYFEFPNGDDTPTFVRNIGNFVSKSLFTINNKVADDCTIIFTHGFALRVIAKFLLKISDEEFRFLKNPPNCFKAIIEINNREMVIKPSLPTIKF